MAHIFQMFYSYILPFAFVLGLLIVVHELGHFLIAKLVGIRVERFSIGFPPRLFGKQIGDTDYCVSAVPFGGYVKMSGMIDESMDTDGIKGEPWEFMSKPIWMRSLVIFAGPAFNVLLTVIIFSASVYVTGIAETIGPIVGQVMKESPAESIGLHEGDIIKAIDGKPIETWNDMVMVIHAASDKELLLEWERNGEQFSSAVTPKLDKIQGVGLIGISPATEMRDAGIFESIAVGSRSTWNLIELVGRSFGLLFSGQVPFKEGLAGPVRIAQMAGDSAKTGFTNLMVFAAFLSLNLGILNLFPFPVLDGGHLVFLGIEAIIRRPLSVKLKMIVQQVGMAILLALMIFVIFNDFSQLFK